MIDCKKITANECEILHAALVGYDVVQAARARRTKLAIVHSDVKWRRYLVAELLRTIDKS
jgi:hypothetical protein